MSRQKAIMANLNEQVHTRGQHRWQSAQIGERLYWQGYKNSRSRVKPLIDKYWSRYLEVLKDYLKPRAKVLDIGCGPDGLINYIDNAEKYGLDP
jgi:hypothetical protein